MFPTAHLAISSGLAGLGFAATRSLKFAVGVVVGGFLIDGDHVPETFLGIRYDKADRVWIPLHSYELVTAALGVGALLWKREPFVAGIAVGMLMHVLTDQVSNHVHPLAYFFTFRARKGFRRRAFTGRAEVDGMAAIAETPGYAWLRKRFGPEYARRG